MGARSVNIGAFLSRLRDPEFLIAVRQARRRGSLAAGRRAVGIGAGVVRHVWEQARPHVRERRDGEAVPPLKRIQADGSPRHLFNPADLVTLGTRALRADPVGVRNVIATARNIGRGSYPCPAPAPIEADAARVWTSASDDAEIHFHIHRWYFGRTLAKAYVYTGDASHGETFMRHLQAWAAAYGRRPTPREWEPYSVGERVCNWLFAAHALRQSPQSRAIDAVLSELLPVHARFLYTHLETRTRHNHLLNNARALMTFGLLMPSEDRNAAILARGWRTLLRESARQFGSDGLLREQSTHYHFVAAKRLLEPLLLAEANGREVPALMWDRARVLFTAARRIVRPDGSLPLVGDVCPDETPSSSVAILTVAHARLGVASHAPVVEDAIWYLGGAQPPRPVAPQTGKSVFPDAGLAVFSDLGRHVVFRAPQPPWFHGHDDGLTLDLWIGQPIVEDPGNATYAPGALRSHMTSAWAHGTLSVDGESPWPADPVVRRILGLGSTGATHLSLDAGPGVVFRASATHRGYERLDDPVTLQREVALRQTNVLEVTDLVVARGRHSLELRWPLGELLAWDAGEGVWHAGHEKDDPLVSIQLDLPPGFVVRVTRGSTDPAEGWRAPMYGAPSPASQLVAEGASVGPTTIRTMFSALARRP